jgi:non-ribosomal peptide synthetase component F
MSVTLGTGTTGVHRIVEIHAAMRGDDIALVGRERTFTYRELNQRGNALARYFIRRGFRRGSSAIVAMDACPDLAVVLLAVLKAGGSYTWLDHSERREWPCGISFDQEGVGRGEQRHVAIDLQEALAASARPAANLPIVTRPTDIACVLPQRNGLPGVRVPHAAITAPEAHPRRQSVGWSSEPGALDIWRPLMTGMSVMLTAVPKTGVAAAA